MLLNVHLPRVVLVHDAEDFVDQTAFLLQDAATSVENPTVLSWDQTWLRSKEAVTYCMNGYEWPESGLVDFKSLESSSEHEVLGPVCSGEFKRHGGSAGHCWLRHQLQ